MKNATITLLLALLTVVSYSQDSLLAFKIKDYSLRDFIAPDIKYNRLTLGSYLTGNGTSNGNTDRNSFYGNINTQLYTYRNSLNFQGSGSTNLELSIINNRSEDNITKNTKVIPNLNLSHNSNNRWYNSNDGFLGMHPKVAAYFSYANTYSDMDTIQNSTIENRETVRSSVILSAGTGRIQPVTAARRAMDILISLEKYNRLSKKPTRNQIDSLAKITNTIAFKRFYDRRFKRIYQLEELDKEIGEMGIIDNKDMVYAANLSDIWNYGITYSRGSGSRFEFGIIPLIEYNHEKNNFNNNIRERFINSYGLTGFASWVRQTPLNYQWQSDFSINLNYAVYESSGQYYNTNKIETSKDINSQLLGLKWTAGYFPNTRTSLQVGPFVNLTAAQIYETQGSINPKDTDVFGMATGLDFKSYYYVSPRFRLELLASTAFISDNYININPDANLIANNGFQDQSIDSNQSGTNIFQYNYRFAISYAIF